MAFTSPSLLVRDTRAIGQRPPACKSVLRQAANFVFSSLMANLMLNYRTALIRTAQANSQGSSSRIFFGK